MWDFCSHGAPFRTPPLTFWRCAAPAKLPDWKCLWIRSSCCFFHFYAREPLSPLHQCFQQATLHQFHTRPRRGQWLPALYNANLHHAVAAARSSQTIPRHNNPFHDFNQTSATESRRAPNKGNVWNNNLTHTHTTQDLTFKISRRSPTHQVNKKPATHGTWQAKQIIKLPYYNPVAFTSNTPVISKRYLGYN